MVGAGRVGRHGARGGAVLIAPVDLDIAALEQWADTRNAPDPEVRVFLFPYLCDDLAATLRELEAARQEISAMRQAA